MTPKFRAWQIEHCEMCDVTAIDYNGKRFGFGRQLDQEHFNEPDYWLFMDECITRQSTGRDDESGIEIFEGDIVEVDCNRKPRFDGDITKHIGRVYRHIGHDGWIFGKYIFFPEYSYKIVGNIYENPELLEQSND